MFGNWEQNIERIIYSRHAISILLKSQATNANVELLKIFISFLAKKGYIVTL